MRPCASQPVPVPRSFLNSFETDGWNLLLGKVRRAARSWSGRFWVSRRHGSATVLKASEVVGGRAMRGEYTPRGIVQGQTVGKDGESGDRLTAHDTRNGSHRAPSRAITATDLDP